MSERKSFRLKESREVESSNAARQAGEGFTNERGTYLAKLKAADKKGPWPDSLKIPKHSLAWPIDLKAPGVRLALYYNDQANYVTSKPGSYLERERQESGYDHSGIDLQTEPGTAVIAPADMKLLYISEGRTPGDGADYHLYSEKYNLYLGLGHMNPDEIPPEFQRARKKFRLIIRQSEFINIPVSESQLLGKVGEFHPDKKLSPFVKIDADVAERYGRSYNHLHIGTHFGFPDESRLDNGVEDINPILLFKKVY